LSNEHWSTDNGVLNGMWMCKKNVEKQAEEAGIKEKGQYNKKAEGQSANRRTRHNF
tara:strand:+ start:334 stop:501 length:168 start_codon:yes stop_codon:yes gene_type:complete